MNIEAFGQTVRATIAGLSRDAGGATTACAGHPVRLITGTAPNPKVTVPDDLPYIELLLKRGVE